MITDTPLKCTNAKDDWLPSVGGEFGSCSVSLMDFTEFELQRIPYRASRIISIKA
ncbi:hypothetical protein HpMS29_03210 [Helicobacter pylori]